LFVSRFTTIPASHAETSGAPITGTTATRRPATISTPPTKYMKSCPLPGTMLLIQGAR